MADLTTNVIVGQAGHDALHNEERARINALGIDKRNAAHQMLYAHDGTSGLQAFPANATEAQKRAVIDNNSSLIRAAMIAKPHALTELDPSDAWPAQIVLNEISDATLTTMPRKLKGRLRLVRGMKTSSSDDTTAAGRVGPAPCLSITRKAGTPIVVTSIAQVQVGPNLPSGVQVTQAYSGITVSSGYNQFRAGTLLLLRCNDYYRWAFEAVGSNTVWKAKIVTVKGLLVTVGSYSVAAMNTAQGSTLDTLERRTIQGATSGVTAVVQSDQGTGGQITVSSQTGDFVSGEQIKDQSSNAVIGTFTSSQVLIAKLNTSYTGPIGGTGANATAVVQIIPRMPVEIDVTIEADGDPEDPIASYNRAPAMDFSGVVDYDVKATIRAGYAAGVEWYSCFNGYENIDVRALPNHALASATDVSYGYCSRKIGACGNFYAEVTGSLARHVFTTNGFSVTYAQTSTNYWRYGPGAVDGVIKVRGYDMYGQSVDCHEGAERLTFVDPYVLNTGSLGRNTTNSDAIVIRGFGIKVINPMVTGCRNGVVDYGIGLDSGGIVYTNMVIGGYIHGFQQNGLDCASAAFSTAQSRILWKDVDLRADTDVLVSQQQTVGVIIRSAIVRTEGLRIGGVNYAMVRHVGDTTGRATHDRWVWDWTDSTANFGLRQDVARPDMLGRGTVYVNPASGAKPQAITTGQTGSVLYEKITPVQLDALTTVPPLMPGGSTAPTRVLGYGE